MPRKDPQAGKKTEESLATHGANLAGDATIGLSTELIALLEQHRASIAADFKASSEVINNKLDKIQAEVVNQEGRIGDLETNAEEVSQRLASLEATCVSIHEENKLLKNKLSDLEGRSRRQNVRMVGLPESLELGPRPTEFVSQLLVDVFGAQTLSTLPELDRAHRSLLPKPGLNEKPRTIIIRFHRFQTKDLVMREVRRRRGTLEFRGHKLQFYEDYTAEVQKQRVQYRDAMAELFNRGFRPSLLFPAKLRITLPDGRNRWLGSVSEATRFIQSTKEDAGPSP
ncbi:unnamed protein product [Knipowitschia caucasica]|uniref:L1 transposable element RRM domain-containing protein n=1 Tax=Knipowitschia caucasica TaxID=637954 RepID=A0AAV2KHU8_KNICA